jgi:hypothetical protein
MIRTRLESMILAVLFLHGVACSQPPARSQDSQPASSMARGPAESGFVRPPDKPHVIWFHSGACNSTESLDTALSSDLITHVLILHMHAADADWQKSPRVLRAIRTVKRSSAKLIWCRDLWPYYKTSGVSRDAMFDPKYYIGEINRLRGEAKAMGADAVALDVEPYGHSPIKELLKSGRRFEPAQLATLRDAVKQAVDRVGQVDYLLPAGSMNKAHPYNILAGLGKARISENTYYANEQTIRNIKYPYEVFGVHLSTARERTINPQAPYFLVSDIFGRSDLWSDKNQLFLYSTSKDSLGVARQLADYAGKLRSSESRASERSGEP